MGTPSAQAAQEVDSLQIGASLHLLGGPAGWWAGPLQTRGKNTCSGVQSRLVVQSCSLTNDL